MIFYEPKSKPPTRLAIVKFMDRWEKAQRDPVLHRSIQRMEALLQIKYLNLWWYSMKASGGSQPWHITCTQAIEQILQKVHLIGTPPPRPSEAAAAKALR